eukprot:maker-scaffold_2-snap-gene-16.36-mRNA-1 protein AED:0.00 eAED:0.00 QI:119/1/1/1/1/1/2/122/71
MSFANAFKNLLSNEVSRDFIVIGMGTGAFVLGVLPAMGLSKEYRVNDSPFSRRYIGKYKRAAKEKFGEAAH